MNVRSLPSCVTCLILLSTAALSQEEKDSVPDASSRSATLKEIKELFASDYAKNSPEDRIAFAAKLLSEGVRSKADTSSCFVLLDEARLMATEAGDVATAFKAIDTLEEFFDLDQAKSIDSHLEMKQDVLGKVQRVARTPDDARSLAKHYLSLARESATSGDFKIAQDSVRKGGALARRSRDKALTYTIALFSKEVPELKREHAAAMRVDPTKAIDIGDHKTNLAIGRYLSFAKGDLEKGLEFLLWTGDKELNEAAKKDLARPGDPEAQLAAGEAWYLLAQNERNPLHKRRYQGRAQFWFEKAELEAEGMVRLKAAKRLDELEVELPGVVNLLRMVDPERDAVEGEWTKQGRALVCEPGPKYRIEIPYTPPEEYDLTLVAHRFQGNDTLAVGLVHSRSQFTAWIDGIPGEGPFTGLSVLDGFGFNRSPVRVKGTHLTSDRPNTIVCSVRKDGVTISIDDIKVFEWKGNLSRLNYGPVWTTKTPRALLVGAWVSRIRFSRITLTPITGTGKKLK